MDPTAFTHLVRQHKKLIHKVSGTYCRNLADRDDVAQEIVLQLWRSRHAYDPDRRASTWVYRIALNVAISFYRRERRHTERGRAPEEALITVAATPETEPDEDMQALQRCITELDELNRALLLLYLDGNDHATIAEILGLSVSNVGTKLSRIKNTLKHAFERHASRA
jgi:RNA polymerase sigma factor (sigma-70 family)